jgi:hypothetical protein
VEEHGIAQAAWLQGKAHCLGPAVGASMEQLLEHALREVPNGSLGDAILEILVDTTKSELLPCIVAGLLEGVVMELPIVVVVVLNSHAMLGSVLLKGTFGGKYLNG